MIVIIGISMSFIMLLGVIGLSTFANLDIKVIALIAFALSFSSTVFAVKVFEEKSEMNSLYGKIAIGILVVQDIIAVLFLAISAGKVPSVWAFGLLLFIPFRTVLHRMLEKSGHGELQILFGLSIALGGAVLFELVGIKGDLGALILGTLLASSSRASELSRHLLGFKDLFLVGFFLAIGLSGPLGWDTLTIGLLLLLLIPLKAILFFVLMNFFNLRSRTSLLASLSLGNYSEFGLIVVTIAVSSGWLASHWLIIIAISVSLSFIVAAPINSSSYIIYAKVRSWILRFQSSTRITEEQDIYCRKTNVIIFGMGRIGLGAYDEIRQHKGQQVLGVDIDDQLVTKLSKSDRNVIRGSATDPDFWNQIHLDFKVINIILLAMPNTKENMFAATQLKEQGYTGKLAAIVKYKDEIKDLKEIGIHDVFDLYAEAGAGFAESVFETLEPDMSSKNN
jgi:predicted Kef-type K+ transport protein